MPPKIDYDTCPSLNIVGGFKRWVEEGIYPGSFTTSVLENNLHQAYARADYTNKPILGSIIKWVYWNLPANCWGSKEKMKEWKQKKDDQRTERLD